MGRQGYPPEFRRKVLDLLDEGRSVAQIAHDLDISEKSIYPWRRQDRIDKGLIPGLTSKEKSELSAAKDADAVRRISFARRSSRFSRSSSLIRWA